MQYWNTTTCNSLLFTLFLSLTGISLLAQDNSPYSRFGLGNIRPQENVANRGMGGTSIADDNPLIANPTNPATYTGLKMTSYQVALDGSIMNLKNNNGVYRTGGSTLSYVNIGLAVSKKMGFSFGLLPFTRAKYSMLETKDLGFATASNNFYGGGGLQKIYVGAARSIGIVSIGLNMGYTFGNLVNTSESDFTDSLRMLSNNITGRTTMGGLFWQAGTLVNYKIKGETYLKIGATYTASQTINGKRETYWQSFLGNVTSPDYSVTIDSVSNLRGKIKIPQQLAAGILYKVGDHWQVGLDFVSSDWSTYRNYDQPDSFGNAYLIRAGGAITPDVNSVNNYWKKMTYRAGIYSGHDAFRFNTISLPRMGFTLGLGYPIRRTNLSIGQINAALDFGRRGTTDNGLIRENYTRFAIGLTFNDKWFIKRRYD